MFYNNRVHLSEFQRLEGQNPGASRHGVSSGSSLLTRQHLASVSFKSMDAVSSDAVF